MDIKQQIGQRIKELRQRAGLKQSELAEKAGIATKHQSCIETGKNFPSADLLEKYAVVFNIDTADLLAIQRTKERSEMEKEIFGYIKNSNSEQLLLAYKILRGIFV